MHAMRTRVVILALATTSTLAWGVAAAASQDPDLRLRIIESEILTTSHGTWARFAIRNDGTEVATSWTTRCIIRYANGTERVQYLDVYSPGLPPQKPSQDSPIQPGEVRLDRMKLDLKQQGTDLASIDVQVVAATFLSGLTFGEVDQLRHLGESRQRAINDWANVMRIIEDSRAEAPDAEGALRLALQRLGSPGSDTPAQRIVRHNIERSLERVSRGVLRPSDALENVLRACGQSHKASQGPPTESAEK